MNIKLDRLKSFLLVAEESNLTRAAARRHSTPSAVSEHLRQLEDELQVLLFERSKQGMSLTAAGEQLLAPVRQVFSAVENVRNTALTLRSTPQATIRLGLNSPPEYLRIDEVLRIKTTVLPHLNVEMKTRSSAQIIGQVLSEDLDLGYVYGNWKDARLRIVPLAPVQVAVVGPADASIDALPDDFEARRRLPWIWPNRECPFYDFMGELLGPQATIAEAATSSDDEYSTVVMAKSGMGFGLVEREFALQSQQRGAIRIFDEPALRTDLSLVCGIRSYERADIRAMFDLIVSEWQS